MKCLRLGRRLIPSGKSPCLVETCGPPVVLPGTCFTLYSEHMVYTFPRFYTALSNLIPSGSSFGANVLLSASKYPSV